MEPATSFVGSENSGRKVFRNRRRQFKPRELEGTASDNADPPLKKQASATVRPPVQPGAVLLKDPSVENMDSKVPGTRKKHKPSHPTHVSEPISTLPVTAAVTIAMPSSQFDAPQEIVSQFSKPNKHRRHKTGKHDKAAADVPETAEAASVEDAVVSNHSASILHEGHLTSSLFSSLAIHPLTKRGIDEGLKYRFMTDVQQMSIPEVLKRKDVFVKAKTGTGKTLAFVIPSIEVLLSENLVRINSGGSAASMVLVLSPTRELALQIATEAAQVCKFHSGFNIVTVVGGTNLNKDQRLLEKGRKVDLLIATPGRLIQHFEETNGFVERCQGVKVLVLDEADRLLDMGFKRDLNKIMDFLKPKQPIAGAKRLTLLFSATYTTEMKEIAAKALTPGYSVIDTVGEEQDQTHEHVDQMLITVPINQQPFELLAILERHKKTNPRHKIIVFFPTARQTGYMATLFKEAKVPVYEIHSRKSQSQRTKASDDFRASTNGIMFSSDVTARGMDYPDVTLVVQVGLTTREQYIHRIGRTARAGKGGSGVIMCAPFEERCIKKDLFDLPIVQSPFVTTTLDLELRNTLEAKMRSREVLECADSCWAAWLGFYNSNLRKLGWSTGDLVANARVFSESMTLEDIPELEPKTIGKMGLKGVAGLRVMGREAAIQRHQQKGPQKAPPKPQPVSQPGSQPAGTLNARFAGAGSSKL